MKKYQQLWLESLTHAQNKSEIAAICEEILDDDTGGTDALTQKLAELLRFISE